MGVFLSAPVANLSHKKVKKPVWNQFAQRAKERKQLRLLVAENQRLRMEVHELKKVVTRLTNDLEFEIARP